jgi:hypothetical protein
VGLGDGAGRVVEEVEGEAARHDVEGGVGEVEVVGVHRAGGELREAGVVGGQGAEHGRGVVDRQDLAALADRPRGGARDGAAPGGDVQDPLAGGQFAPGHEIAAEGGEERDLLVVIGGERVEEAPQGHGVRHGWSCWQRRGGPFNRLSGGVASPTRDYSGMLPCFFGGSRSRLVRSARRPRTMWWRVWDGMMTAST